MKTVSLTAGIIALTFAYSAHAAPLSAEQRLGRRLFKDTDLSKNRNQSCESCHGLSRVRIGPGDRLPSPGFVDPDNVQNNTPTSNGSNPALFGGLNAPTAGYAAFSPRFFWNAEEGLFMGGQFWNGRAATLAEQAKGPFLNPVEMGMPSKWSVVSRLKEDQAYVNRFRRIYDIDLDAIPSNCNAPASATPPPGVFAAYDAMANAIAEFEKSKVFNRFNSKFDFVLAGVTTYTPQEALGEQLFNGAAQCNLCHPATPGLSPDGTMLPPVFTDFSYDNLGAGRNTLIPGNPAPDVGLAGNPVVQAYGPGTVAGEMGKHKVSSLRNLSITGPYLHNGLFTSLDQVVRFYNRRDLALAGTNGMYTCTDNTDPNFGTTCFPAPEVPDNVNTDELGDLGLSDAEEDALIAFLLTLTDGYDVWGMDPNVPPGTPSPFANTALPPSP